MIVQHNMTAAGTNRMLKQNENTKLKSFEKLSSGYKINRAADNAAGLAISEKMRSQIRGLNRAERNVQEGINFVQTADGALSEIEGMMHRIHELAVQAANDTNTDEDRAFIDEEIQMYKEEINYIFEETEFNTIKIWDTNTNNRVQIGTERKQAVKLDSYGWKNFTVTQANKGAIAYNGYKIEIQGTDKTDAANYGFKVKWEGWNKEQYSTDLISWDNVGQKGFRCNLSDYVDTAANPELAGIDFPIGWTSEESATIDDIANSINGVVFSSSVSSSENVAVNQNVPGVSFSINTDYLAELASGRNVDNYDTTWIEPAQSGTPNVIDMPSYTDPAENKGWKIHFNMPNIGLVTATSTSVRYFGNALNGPEGKWWKYNKNYHPWLVYMPGYSPGVGSDGTLLGVTDCITDSTRPKRDYSLTHADTDGGSITVRLDLTADNGTFTYEGRTSSNNYVGYINMYITVNRSDTEESIMNKIKSVLNENTIFDAYEGNQNQGTPYYTTASAYYATERTHLIDVPVYETNHDRAIQAGANTDQAIHIVYKSLRLMNLGIYDSNVLTREAASQTISDIQVALDIVSEQRSLFGAYQNRLEHAGLEDANTSENTQMAESRLRDTDMADEMVINAKASILEQSTQAMLVQANRQTEGVLSLLG